MATAEKDDTEVFYEIIGEAGTSVSVLTAKQMLIDRETKEEIGYRHTAEPYIVGEFVSSKVLSPEVQRLYDENDEHIRACYKRLPKGQRPPAEPHEPDAKPKPPAFDPLAESVEDNPVGLGRGRAQQRPR